MRIRYKLMGLLILASLLPVMLVRFADAWSIRRLGQRMADDARSQLIDLAKLELSQYVAGYTRMVDRERQIVELTVKLQAQAVEARLAGLLPASPVRVYMDSEFDDPAAPPPGLGPSPMHLTPDAHGRLMPVLVSYETQVMRLSPGVAMTDAIRQDMARLADMTAVYRDLGQGAPDIFLWQFTALTNGLHTSFPGKGGYPSTYDPRERDWFRTCMEERQPVWISPMPDVTTKLTTLTFVHPVRRPDGEIAGVTAADVAQRNVVGRDRLPETWRDSAVVAMVYLAEPESIPPPQLAAVQVNVHGRAPVVVASSTAEHGVDWQARRLPPVFSALNEREHARIVEDMRQGVQGFAQAPLHGGDYLWAYGPVDQTARTFLFVMVPFGPIAAEADRVESQVLGEIWRMLQLTGVVGLVIALAAIVLAWRGSRSVTRPVIQLADAAHRIASGDLDARVPMRKERDELTEMAEAFNNMAPKLRDRMEIRQSLALAMEVQQSLLPESPPQAPGMEIAGQSLYCDETGGDYYDFLQFEKLGAQRVGVVIGDVAGHGVAAALLMATARALLRSRAASPGSIAEIFTDVNAHLNTSRFTGRFMTAFFLVLDSSERSMRWVSAGHDPAIIYDPEADDFSEIEGVDIPLGVMADYNYHEHARKDWSDGRVIVLGTDGIWECRDPSGDMYGKDRLRQIIRRHAQESAADIANAIQIDVLAFRGKQEQQDDITLVVVKLRDEINGEGADI